jgi:AcrR family transcriptional regulator
MDHKTRLRHSSPDRREKDARVLRTREALRSALIDLLARHDFPDVTVAMIVAEAGIGYATFFRHYPDTTTLLTEIADVMIAEFLSMTLPAMITGDHHAVMIALVDFIADRRPLCHALLIGGGEAVRRDLIARALTQAASLPNLFAPDIPFDLAMTHAVNSTVTAATWWLRSGDEGDRLRLANLLERLAVAPVIR